MFFISLWGFAFMLGADRAATLGWVYLGLRALYAPIWMILGGEGGPPVPALFISTFPQYGINAYMAFAIVFKYGQSEDLKDSFEHDLVGALVITILFLMYAAGFTPVLNKALTGFFAPPSEPEKTPEGSTAVATSEEAAESQA